MRTVGCSLHVFPLVCFSLLSLGCGSKLAVVHSDTPGSGILVPRQETYAVTKRIEKLDRNKMLCETETVQKTEFISVPGAKFYTVNVDPAWFAKTEFSLEFGDSGILKRATLNSDPQIDETITATATLVKETAGLVAKVAPAAVALNGQVDISSCGTFKNETIVRVQTLEDWKVHPNGN